MKPAPLKTCRPQCVSKWNDDAGILQMPEQTAICLNPVSFSYSRNVCRVNIVRKSAMSKCCVSFLAGYILLFFCFIKDSEKSKSHQILHRWFYEETLQLNTKHQRDGSTDALSLFENYLLHFFLLAWEETMRCHKNSQIDEREPKLN